MKNKLSLILLLLFVLNLEGSVPVKGTSSTTSFSPDGNPIAKQRGRKRRQRRARRRAKVAGTSGMGMGSGGSNANTAAPTEEPMVGASPTGMPMPKPPIDVNKKSAPAPSKSAPGIKPPTVQIKPPTR